MVCTANPVLLLLELYRWSGCVLLPAQAPKLRPTPLDNVPANGGASLYGRPLFRFALVEKVSTRIKPTRAPRGLGLTFTSIRTMNHPDLVQIRGGRSTVDRVQFATRRVLAPVMIASLRGAGGWPVKSVAYGWYGRLYDN